jgi:hypothetical protein
MGWLDWIGGTKKGRASEVRELHPDGLLPQAEAVDRALDIGTVTLLLEESPDLSEDGVRALLEDAGVLDEATLEFDPVPRLRTGGRTMEVLVGREPFPAHLGDTRLCEEDFDFGNGFLAISAGLPDVEIATRRVAPNVPDPWAEHGHMRRLTSIVQKLAPLSTGVVLLRAGVVVVPTASWLEWSGDVSDLSRVPMDAWVDIGFTPDRRLLVAQGLSAFGFEPIGVDMKSRIFDAEIDVAYDALLVACDVLARENRALRNGEVLRVDGAQMEFVVSIGDEGPILHWSSATAPLP